MRQFTTILFILTFWTVTTGQTSKILGQIGDGETKFPKTLVVLYKDSKIIKKTWTDEKGSFKIDSIENGIYELTVKQLGAFNTKLTNLNSKHNYSRFA